MSQNCGRNSLLYCCSLDCKIFFPSIMIFCSFDVYGKNNLLVYFGTHGLPSVSVNWLVSHTPGGYFCVGCYEG